jgi:hypothetical protein
MKDEVGHTGLTFRSFALRSNDDVAPLVEVSNILQGVLNRSSGVKNRLVYKLFKNIFCTNLFFIRAKNQKILCGRFFPDHRELQRKRPHRGQN